MIQKEKKETKSRKEVLELEFEKNSLDTTRYGQNFLYIVESHLTLLEALRIELKGEMLSLANEVLKEEANL